MNTPTPETDTITPNVREPWRKFAERCKDLARKLERQRDAAREDAERLATALRLAQYGETDECVVCGRMIRCATTCEIGTALAAHEALKAGY